MGVTKLSDQDGGENNSSNTGNTADTDLHTKLSLASLYYQKEQFVATDINLKQASLRAVLLLL